MKHFWIPSTEHLTDLGKQICHRLASLRMPPPKQCIPMSNRPGPVEWTFSWEEGELRLMIQTVPVISVGCKRFCLYFYDERWVVPSAEFFLGRKTAEEAFPAWMVDHITVQTVPGRTLTHQGEP